MYWIVITDVSRTCSKLSSKQSKLQSLRGFTQWNVFDFAFITVKIFLKREGIREITKRKKEEKVNFLLITR